MTTRNIEVTIANGAPASNAIPTNGWRIYGILKPATWTAADISFEIDPTGSGTFVKVVDAAGALVKITGVSETVAELMLVPEIADTLTSYKSMKVCSTNTASEADVNQGGARVLQVCLVPISPQ